MRSAMNMHRVRLFAFKSLMCVLALSAIPLVSAVQKTEAANLQFTSTVTPPNTCTMIVRRDGDLGVSTDKKTLSSKIAGGLSGIVDVFSAGSYDVYADAPGGFTTAPFGGNAGVSMLSRFSGIDIFRGRTFAEQDGSIPVTLRTGISITRMNIHLIATRPTEFPGGDYTGVVTLRCE